MKYDRILILVAGLFFIIFYFVVRFFIIDTIKKSDNKSEENKKKEIKRGKFISFFLLVIAIYWLILFMVYDKLF